MQPAYGLFRQWRVLAGPACLDQARFLQPRCDRPQSVRCFGMMARVVLEEEHIGVEQGHGDAFSRLWVSESVSKRFESHHESAKPCKIATAACVDTYRPLSPSVKCLLQRRGHRFLAAGGDPAPVAEIGVVLGEGTLDGNVAGGAFAVAGRHDERVRPED